MILSLITILTITMATVFSTSSSDNLIVENLNINTKYLNNVKQKELVKHLCKEESTVDVNSARNSKSVKRHKQDANFRLQQHIKTLDYLTKLEMYYENHKTVQYLSTKHLNDILNLKADVKKLVLETIEEISLI